MTKRYFLLCTLALLAAVCAMCSGCAHVDPEYCRHRVASSYLACIDKDNEKRPWADQGGPRSVRLTWFRHVSGKYKHIETEVESPEGDRFYLQGAQRGGFWVKPVASYKGEWIIIGHPTFEEWLRKMKPEIQPERGGEK